MDTSAAAASCALLEDDRPIAQFYTDAHLTHSQTIMPMVESLLSCSHMTIQQVDLFAASVGPGSFTGLRIGVAAVKGMAQVLDKPCAAVPHWKDWHTTCPTAPASSVLHWMRAAVRSTPPGSTPTGRCSGCTRTVR